MTHPRSYSELYEFIIQRADGHGLTLSDYEFENYHGESLLYLACKEGRLSAVQTLIAYGVDINRKLGSRDFTALEWALHFGEIAIADYLYLKGGHLPTLALTACRPDGQRWMKKRFTALIQDYMHPYEKPILTCQARQQLQPQSPMSILTRLAEIYDEKKHAKYLEFLLTKKHSVQVALCLAVAQDKTDFIRRVVHINSRFGEPILKEFDKDSPYLFAIREGKFDYAEVIANNVVWFDFKDNFGRSALLNAARDQNLAALQYALKLPQNFLLSDIDGNNLMHYIAHWNAPSAIMAVNEALEYEVIDYLKRQENNHAVTANAILRQAVALEPTKNRISHQKINQNIYYYLNYQGRDSSFFNPSGNCHGLRELFFHYAGQHRRRYLKSSCQLLVDWDGDMSKLAAPIQSSKPQSAHYPTLGDFFEAWANDLIWLQHHAQVSQLSGLDQNDISKQYAIVASQEDVPITYSTVLFEALDASVALPSLIAYFMRLPAGSRLSLGGSHHATGLLLHSEGRVEYYDANIGYFQEKTTSEFDVAKRILDYKYIHLNQTDGENAVQLQLSLCGPADDAFGREMAAFELFSEAEYPKNAREAMLFMAASPNGMNHLQLAALYNSQKSIKRLLADGYCQIAYMDKSYNRVFAYHNHAANQFIVEHFTQHDPDCLGPYLLELYRIGGLAVCESLLSKLSNSYLKLNLLAAFITADELKRLFEQNLIGVNQSYTWEPISHQLLVACFQDIEKVKVCLAYGADINVRSGANGDTLAHKCFSSSKSVLLAELLKNKADLTIKSKAGKTPMQTMSLPFLDADEIKLILEYKPELLPQDASILLISAVAAHDVQLMQSILDAYPHCDLNHPRAPNAYSALHLAIMRSQYELCVFLLELGADPNNQAGMGAPLWLLVEDHKNYSAEYIDLFLAQENIDLSIQNSDGITLEEALDEIMPGQRSKLR